MLSHKATKFFGKVATGLLKASTKIDIAGDNEKETSLSISLPDINVNSLLNSDEKLILIFDDLERCLLPIPEIFGYINYFVEHTKSKAIIVGNEAEILKKDNDKKYSIEKEKLIGTTFEFYGDAKSALSFFIDSIPRTEILSRKDIKFMLKDRIEFILEIYELSKHQNIRTLKQSLNEFVRFYHECFFTNEKDVFDNKLFNEILKFYLIFSIEYRSGIFDGKILKFKKNNQDSEKEDESDKLHDKYNLEQSYYHILDVDLWNNIIVNNIVEKNVIRQNLNDNYFVHTKEPSEWYKLWHYYDLNNDEFERVYNNALDKLKKSEWEEFGEVLHVMAALIYFNENKVKDINLDDFQEYALKNIKNICDKKDREYRNNFDHFMDRDNWGGYSYLGRNDEKFEIFFNSVKVTIQDYEDKNLNNEAKELLGLIKSDPELFGHRICLTNSKENLFFEIPILKEVDVDEFTNSIIELNRVNMFTIINAMKERYQIPNPYFEKIKIEKDWFYNVIAKLKSIAQTKTSIEKFSLENILIYNLEKIYKDCFS